MSTNTVSPLFVGRADELALLEGALGRARDGAASTVLVGGEAGVGKTRLIREFAERAEGARVLVGGCLELGTDGLPFAPFTAVLRRLVRDLGRDAIAELLPGGSTRGLGRLLPEFGEPEGDGPEARARLFEQVLGLLERLAEQRETVLIVEDAHWADRSTRDLLSFLVRYQRSDLPLLIVVTYRADELHRTHPLRPLLAELGRVDWVTRLELRRLSRREVVEQATSILGGLPGRFDVDDVYSRSEGNPLFVEALLSGDGHDAVPESLRDLLLASVERLPEETQELLRVASAGGARIEHALLTAVAGLDEGSLSRALRPAVAGNVLVVDGEGYSFRHALIREAVHDDLLPGERTRLHTRFARTLEDNPLLLPATRAAIELAHHWHAAHDVRPALVSAWRAAAAARRATAFDEQLRMLSRVLELWDQVPDAAGLVETDHLEVLDTVILVAHLAGEFERAISLSRAALRLVDAERDPITTAGLLRRRGLAAYDLGRAGYVDDLRTAARLVPASPPSALRAKILEALARMLNTPDVWAEKEAHAEEALRIARQIGDAKTEAQSLITLTWSRGHRAVGDQDLSGYAEARTIAGGARAYTALMRAAISESDTLEGWGRHEAATEVARRGIAEAEEYGVSRTSGAFLAINLAEPLVSLGRWDEALEVIEHALDLAPPPPYRASLMGFSLDILLARGDLEGAEALFHESRGILAQGTYRDQTLLPNLRRELELRLAQGDDARALELIAAALRERNGHVNPRLASPRYGWPFLVSALHATTVTLPTRTSPSSVTAGAPGPAGEPATLEEVVRELRDVAAKLEIRGDLQRAQSLTFAALTAHDLATWDTATQAWEELGQPYARAQALLAAAEAALAPPGGREPEGQPSAVRESVAQRLSTARALAERLGAVPLLTEIDALARRARISLTGEALAEETRLGLTAREFEVLKLVTRGMSNREIAGELFISVKTVSVHVSNILGKLGASSRGEAAATAHRLHLFATP
ncbi:helix-turn-helix transcriptional regulator [Nonomuraea africana]|uniref:DNA-binding CsgD family transcriptional regulator/tetratricopeptide (TPR) repeat protein n=1 Tax=Nonomuraea africana TaxID=46171 RepID=A0ABR9KA14_9ACTN|nr:helix-turn-helix transcriptional regulator [Nonomuraea africana]MBE1558641.1 DNA-binding CsgD family transcriptional regulator/tetratricopeptide (TPR) repeat protein [Nonomuraea africana]